MPGMHGIFREFYSEISFSFQKPLSSEKVQKGVRSFCSLHPTSNRKSHTDMDKFLKNTITSSGVLDFLGKEGEDAEVQSFFVETLTDTITSTTR